MSLDKLHFYIFFHDLHNSTRVMTHMTHPLTKQQRRTDFRKNLSLCGYLGNDSRLSMATQKHNIQYDRIYFHFHFFHKKITYTFVSVGLLLPVPVQKCTFIVIQCYSVNGKGTCNVLHSIFFRKFSRWQYATAQRPLLIPLWLWTMLKGKHGWRPILVPLSTSNQTQLRNDIQREKQSNNKNAMAGWHVH